MGSKTSWLQDLDRAARRDVLRIPKNARLVRVDLTACDAGVDTYERPPTGWDRRFVEYCQRCIDEWEGTVTWEM